MRSSYHKEVRARSVCQFLRTLRYVSNTRESPEVIMQKRTPYTPVLTGAAQ